MSPLGSPKGNCHTVTGLGFDMVSEMEQAALVTHGQSHVPRISY